ncbi:hypothetical protein LR48_Vigan05g084000 [Vigna angularis]|uniref:Uncharacterized protein n=1 Tax=Phaseolus angularis TaxID=3914 RepID=A0A0L9UKL8_PHAAN|nr:hypothetical protein LR48_Vigan05g084000 [Vigna angularis]
MKVLFQHRTEPNNDAQQQCLMKETAREREDEEPKRDGQRKWRGLETGTARRKRARDRDNHNSRLGQRKQSTKQAQSFEIAMVKRSKCNCHTRTQLRELNEESNLVIGRIEGGARGSILGFLEKEFCRERKGKHFERDAHFSILGIVSIF